MKTDRIYIQDKRQERVPLWVGLVRWMLFAAILFLPGLLAGSSAMQWAGFLVLLVGSFIAATNQIGKPMSIKEARLFLDDLEARSTDGEPT